MLSQPWAYFSSRATRSLNSLSINTFLSFCCSRSCFTWLTIFWLLLTYFSHTPSHASRIKLSAGLL